ncbi:MAG: glycosyltransferase [Candidatus Nanohaloarchaea archaeon]
MKIGFFTDSYFPGIDGVTYTIKAWKERLEERGHEVHVIYPGNPGYEPGENEYPVKSLPNLLYSQYRLPLYKRISNLPELDIVHCHGPASTGIIGRRYAKKKDVKSVYTHHTPVEDYLVRGLKSEILANLAGKLWVFYENKLLEGFDCVTASTSKIDREIEPRKLPVGLEMEFFKPVETEMFEGEEVIGYSGRMSKKKNLEEVLKLAKKMGDKKFVLVGEGPERPKLERLAPENVEFKDFMDRENLPASYSAMDVFITASTCDTLGLSTLEANSCGTPVAAADVEPFNRTIQNGNGSRFKYGDIESMKEAVEDCLNNSRNTREAVKKYSIEETVNQLEEIYEE